MADLYLLDSHQLSVLQRVMRELYGNGSTLTPDARRDLANTLDAVLHQVITLGALTDADVKGDRS